MTKIASKNRRRYFDRKNGIYIDCFRNEWTFMEEVENITRFKELCEQHGVRCLTLKMKQAFSPNVCNTNGMVGKVLTALTNCFLFERASK